ncbi:MAG: hypothetical protein U1E76_10075 [Planctomycetota bacterium]
MLDKSVSEIETMLVHQTHPKEAKAIGACGDGEFSRRASRRGGRRSLRAGAFRDRELPESIERRDRADQLDDGNICAVRPAAQFAKSNGRRGRLIEGGGASVGQEKVTDAELRVPLDEPVLVQAGKRRFARCRRCPRHEAASTERVHRMETR